MKALRRYAPLLGLLVFGALVWLGIYAYQDGFTKKWRKLIVKEFAKHDLTISFDTLTIDPFQGLVANKVILLEGDTKQEIARVSQARLDVDLTKLILNERFLERIELDSANVSLPYDRKDPSSQRVEFKNLQATVVLPDGEIEVVNAEADFYGIRLNLTGALKRPLAGSDETVQWNTEKIRSARPTLEKLIRHLKPLQSETGREPVMSMAISGDLTKPESLELKTYLDGKDFHYGELQLREVSARATITDQLVSLSFLNLTDSQYGRFDMEGVFPLEGKREATVALTSSIDLGKLLSSIGPMDAYSQSIILKESPQISAKGTLRLDQPFQWSAPPADLMGRVETDSFVIGGEPFEGFQADFHLEGPSFIARNIQLNHQFGESSGKIISTPEDGIRYEFSLGMDPTLLQQLPLMEQAKTFLDRWEFRPNSGVKMYLVGERKAQDAASWEHRGDVTLTECRFETAELERLQLDFSLRPDNYRFSQIEAQIKPDHIREYSGGTVKAERVSIRAQDKVVAVKGVHGTIHPGQVVRCFNQDGADYLDSYQFSQAPEIRIPRGTVDLQTGAQTDLELELKATGDLQTEIFDKVVSLSQPRFGLRFLEDGLLVRVDHATLFGGDLAGTGDIRRLKQSRDYTAKLTLTEINFESLAATYFPGHAADGQLTGDFAWRGRGTDLAAVAGSGEARLLNSRLLEVPLLGPFSSLLKRVVGKTKVSQGLIPELGSKFFLESSTITLEALTADVGSFVINGTGTVELPTSAVDLIVSLSNQSAKTAVLNVLYDAFGTYQCTGTLDKPEWTMVNRGDPAQAIKDAARQLGAPSNTMDPDKPSKLDHAAILMEFLRKEREKARAATEDK